MAFPRAVLARGIAVSAVLGAAAEAQLLGYLAVRGALAPQSLAWPLVTAAGVLTAICIPVIAVPLRTLVASR